MTSSLVGSEMCIRDRDLSRAFVLRIDNFIHNAEDETMRDAAAPIEPEPVSYTHLTLPTICSV
eukprot:1700427-Prorocentrum_lima.AAC.1